ncbi:hypothetical protein BURPS406E_G0704 [Burkholderia pseudomallei 406e]|nr:hypothetical protein BURPS406E_G0704 [Burkholderia pseudomallei 406e]EDO93605.1 hypothetical protein BURPSPAST_J0898 [Burkholderia pseudomallei Pasteur 52237]EDS82864.1 hypothetical protein BURPSS13_K0111 [Burkholderia pseudomallei S13]
MRAAGEPATEKCSRAGPSISHRFRHPFFTPIFDAAPIPDKDL